LKLQRAPRTCTRQRLVELRGHEYGPADTARHVMMCLKETRVKMRLDDVASDGQGRYLLATSQDAV